MGTDAPQRKILREKIQSQAVEHDPSESEKLERFKLGGILLQQSGLATQAFSRTYDSLQKSRKTIESQNAFHGFVAAQESALAENTALFKAWGATMESQIHARGPQTLIERLYARYNTLQTRNIPESDRREGFTPASQMLHDGFATGIKAIWYAVLCIPVLYKERTGRIMTKEDFSQALLRSRQFLFARAFASSSQNNRIFVQGMVEPDGNRMIDTAATYGIDSLSFNTDTLTLSDAGERISSDMAELLNLAKKTDSENSPDEVLGCPAPHVAVTHGVNEYPNLIAALIDEITDFAEYAIGGRLKEYTEEALRETSS